MQWQFERLVRRAGPLCAIGGLIWAGTASAATLTAGCTGTTGDVPSLIGTVKAANDLVGPDTIELGTACVYTLTAARSRAARRTAEAVAWGAEPAAATAAASARAASARTSAAGVPGVAPAAVAAPGSPARRAGSVGAGPGAAAARRPASAVAAD